MDANNNQIALQITADDLATAVINGINTAFAQMKNDLKGISKESNSAKTGMDSLLDSVWKIPLAFNQTVAAVQMLWQGLTNLAEPAMQMDKLNTQFKAATGSSELAAQNMQFVREESDRLGMSFESTAESTSKFMASTRGTAIEGEKTRQVLNGVFEATTALKLSTEETNGILLAFSQMMGKGKISAEELNQVGERLPGALDVMAKSMGMTTAEFRKAAEEGRILAVELMEKVGPALSSLYKDSAMEAASGPAAQINRLKNAIFELGAVIGAGPMKAVGDLAGMFQLLASAAKAGLAWLNQEQNGSASAAFAAGLSNIASGIGFVVASLATAAIAYAAYSAAAKLAATATGEFTIALLTNPLVLAGVAAFAGVVAAIKAIADAFDSSAKSASKSGKAVKESAEEQRKSAAETKQLQDEYDKAFGTNIDRQLAKREQQYKDDLEMLDKKLSKELALTGDNEAAKQKLTEKYIGDRVKLNELYYQDTDKMRDAERKKEQASYDARINDYIAFLKATGKDNDADDQSFARKNQKERQELLDYYDKKVADAKANGQVLIGIEAEKQTAIDALQKEQFAEATRRGLDRKKEDVDLAKKSTDAQIAEIRRRAEEGKISEENAQAEILQLQQGMLQKELEMAKQRATTYDPDSKEYKKSLGEIAAAEAALTNNVTEQSKLRETVWKNEIDNRLVAAQNSYQADLNSLQQAENDKTVCTQEATLRRLQLEQEYAAKVASLRAQELSQYDPQTQTKEYEAALSAKLDADRAYLAARQAVLNEETRQFTEQTQKDTEEIQKRVDAEKESVQQSRATAAAWFGLWDDAYNNASASLQKLSDAAYNTFAATYDLPQKTTESLETLKQKAAEASENYAKLELAAVRSGQRAYGTWVTAWTALNRITAEAERVTAEYYKQAVAAEELAQALEKPENQTAQFAQQTEGAIDNLKLLDNTTLDKLKSSVQKIKDAMQAFTDSVKDGLKSLQDDWDNMSMSKLQLEEKRYQDEKEKWQEDMDKAQKQQNKDAITALGQQLELIEKIHNAKVADLKTDAANSSIPGMAVGGKVRGVGTGDTQLRWLDPREWVIRPEAVSHWGDGVMAALNAPWSNAGQFLTNRIRGLTVPAVTTPAPRLGMITGGPVGSLQSSGANVNNHFYITEPLTETAVRRQVIPVIEKYARLKK